MENENKYGYFISYIYIKENFSLDFFSTNTSNAVGNAFISYDKKLEDFVMEDYNKIKSMIGEKICEQLNEYQKEYHEKYHKDEEYKYDDNLVNINHIMIINIIPKKYEVFKIEEDKA